MLPSAGPRILLKAEPLRHREVSPSPLPAPKPATARTGIRRAVSTEFEPVCPVGLLQTPCDKKTHALKAFGNVSFLRDSFTWRRALCYAMHGAA